MGVLTQQRLTVTHVRGGPLTPGLGFLCVNRKPWPCAHEREHGPNSKHADTRGDWSAVFRATQNLNLLKTYIFNLEGIFRTILPHVPAFTAQK